MPSWQARVFSKVLRILVKRKPRMSLEKAVLLTRKKLNPPKFLRPPLAKGVMVTAVEQPGLKGEWVETIEGKSETVVYYLHGGAYVACSPATHRVFTSAIALRSKARVFALDYRLAPENRFPAAVEDSVAGYQWLLGQGIKAGDIIIGGDSAGGGLTLATLIALRDRGIELPRAAFCLSPWTDLAGTGKSLVTNDKSDSMFYGSGIEKAATVYLGDTRPDNPLASPLYGDLTGLPPLLIYASRSEVLLDDSVRLVERARQFGVKADLRLGDGLPHVWPVFIGFKIPESLKAVEEIVEFIKTKTADQIIPNKILTAINQ
ncbi:MAG: alpha/beta hydrolase [Acidobacteria bacterium]|nr:alpha/beta hydrolase [Acidobacteriota bacterium]